MKTEQVVTDAHLRTLFDTNAEQGPLVSMILPMERGGPEVRKNAVVLKNAVRKARTLLEAAGQEEGAVEETLEPVEALIEDSEFWQFQDRTLALYVGPEGISSFVLAHPFPERVMVGPRFFMTPVLHAAQRQHPAFLLKLSQNEVALFALKKGKLEKVELKDLPANKEEALLLDPEKSLQQHIVGHAGKDTIMGMHGHGGGKDTRLGHMTDFFHRVENPVTRFMESRRVPLYLATVEENDALYRKINNYSGLAERSLQGNFERQSDHELLASWAAQIEEDLEQTVAGRCREVAEAVAEGNGFNGLDRAIEAAWDGRVHACCVAMEAAQQTGTWDPDSRKVTYDREPDPLHVDLIDLVAAHAWDKGGELRFVAADALPDSAAVAVSLRY